MNQDRLLTHEKIRTKRKELFPHGHKDCHECEAFVRQQQATLTASIVAGKMLSFIDSYLVTTIEPDGTKMHHIDEAEWKSVKSRMKSKYGIGG